MKIPMSELEEVLENDDNEGFCLACGALQGGVEPDATNYTCDRCGGYRVFGAQQILLMGQYDEKV